jgi:hypothetical protein
MVTCACELTGIDPAEATGDFRLPLSAAEFETELRARFGTSHPELVYRTEVTIQRARLNRSQLPGLPRVILSNGESSRS